jgi:hypothetical protein
MAAIPIAGIFAIRFRLDHGRLTNCGHAGLAVDVSSSGASFSPIPSCFSAKQVSKDVTQNNRRDGMLAGMLARCLAGAEDPSRDVNR